MQSTLARELAELLDLPCILLDTIHWQPGWRECPRDEFRMAVRAALDRDPRGWVVDGNYTSALGSMVSDEATDVICEHPFSRARSLTSPIATPRSERSLPACSLLFACARVGVRRGAGADG